MNYQEKYIKYKTKYLELKNIQLGGSTIINFDDSVKIYKKVVENAANLEKTYAGFWKNIYYNDAYVFYKNAIEYYKNIQNSKFHGFFSSIINKKLFTGSCQYINGARRTDFSSNKDIKKIDLDDLCNLSVQVINILDTVFLNCPTIPYDIVAYRQEFRENNDRLFALKKGDYYKNAGYMSTSINPWYLFFKTEDYESNDIDISMTIYMPKNTKGYYMLHPFGIYYDKSIKKNIGLQEYEILLPRNNIFEVLETKFVGNRFFIKLLLKHQMIPKEHPVSIETSKIQPNYFSTKEYKQLDKSKYEELETNIKNFAKDNTKIPITPK